MLDTRVHLSDLEKCVMRIGCDVRVTILGWCTIQFRQSMSKMHMSFVILGNWFVIRLSFVFVGHSARMLRSLRYFHNIFDICAWDHVIHKNIMFSTLFLGFLSIFPVSINKTHVLMVKFFFLNYTFII